MTVIWTEPVDICEEDSDNGRQAKDDELAVAAHSMYVSKNL